jgi:methylmalonyl-CoA mutase N-terminal domain/subunit
VWRRWASRGRIRSRAAFIPPVIAASCGRCVSSPDSAASDTNARFVLLEHGQTGCRRRSISLRSGLRLDHPRSLGEVGKTGVAISSLADMKCCRRHPLDKVSTSMTINGPAIIVWAFYIAAAERQGVSSEKLRGTIQNDILKEYMAQHAWCFPIEPALRLIVDCFEWGAKHAPLWNTVSISGYHIREAGSTAAQELAFTLADGFTYVERGIARGLDVDDFAPRLSFFWDIHNDFFEEIAKLRAARRIWARHMKERYGEATALVDHALPLADRRCDAHAQQPMNNIARCPQALAAVLGGTQSLHTNSMDETLACRRKRRCRSRCARSKCSRTKPAYRTSSIRWAAPTTSKR